MRKRTVPLLVALALSNLALYAREAHTSHSGPAATEDGIEVYFSPKGGCTDAIVERLNGAKKSISMQGYSLRPYTIS